MGKHPRAEFTHALPKRDFALDYLKPENFALEHIRSIGEAICCLVESLIA